MDEWCTEQHTKSGLVEACLKSEITLKGAEGLILQFLKENGIEKREVPMAGNNVSMDRLFVQFHMPILNEFLHYRIIDVSTVKELCKRWKKGVFQHCPIKQRNHRALDDIKESIEELKFYKLNVFK